MSFKEFITDKEEITEKVKATSNGAGHIESIAMDPKYGKAVDTIQKIYEQYIRESEDADPDFDERTYREEALDDIIIDIYRGLGGR